MPRTVRFTVNYMRHGCAQSIPLLCSEAEARTRYEDLITRPGVTLAELVDDDTDTTLEEQWN